MSTTCSCSLMAMMSKSVFCLGASNEAFDTQGCHSRIEKRIQNSLFFSRASFARTMASYGSLCRCRGLSKLCLPTQRLARPAMNRVRLAKGAVRTLSSLSPRRAEKLATDASPQKQTSNQRTASVRDAIEKAPVRTSPSSLTYTGNATMPITTKLKIVLPKEDPPRGVWPVFRLMVRATAACDAFDCLFVFPRTI